MACPRNPKSNALRECVCNQSVAKYLLGMHDNVTLQGVIDYLDCCLAEAEDDPHDPIIVHCHTKCKCKCKCQHHHHHHGCKEDKDA